MADQLLKLSFTMLMLYNNTVHSQTIYKSWFSQTSFE